MTLNSIDLDELNASLLAKSWFVKDAHFSKEFCQRLLASTSSEIAYEEAEIGIHLRKTKEKSIRNGSLKWIEDWGDSSSLKYLQSFFNEIMLSTSEYFRLSLKRFESQFAYYEEGGFYKRHLDQHRNTRHRHLSCCLYLNSSEQGGELILYKKGSQTEIARVIKPLAGPLVFFISADIFHEVVSVRSERFSVSTWFRDDEILPFL